VTYFYSRRTDLLNVANAWTIFDRVAKESQGYYELEQRKPWFDERRSEPLDRRKQAKLQWLQDRRQINGINLNDT
jgi:hypothetical protein